MSGELDLNDLNDLPVGGGGAAVASEDDENDASTASTSAAPAPMQKKASALMTIKNKLVGSKSNALAISRCRRTRRSSSSLRFLAEDKSLLSAAASFRGSVSQLLPAVTNREREREIQTFEPDNRKKKKFLFFFPFSLFNPSHLSLTLSHSLNIGNYSRRHL
jgi:hypothetical protein